ncbi:accessory factor UbiK family protein [Halomonas sp. GXIMD04776]|uniref:accessory factor UbiK family protein n=1 Tax=Halomonas sp. GXIMD04776 TaxID=3415605 RepID=UPI003CA2F013
MAGNDPISRLAQQVGERLQNASHAPEEIQRSVQGAMRSAFERMELVTREDFDILMDVLQRTRSRVEALEKQVATLEATLDDKAGAAASPGMVAADTAAPPAPKASGNIVKGESESTTKSTDGGDKPADDGAKN